MSEVIRADENDVEVLGQVIADAFFDLPPSEWLIPDLDARRVIFPGYFQLAVEHALANGVVHTTPDRTAAALWLYVEDESPAPSADYESRLGAVTGIWADQILAFDATLEQHHPVGAPHHYLAILAVRPDIQGRGLGSLLLSTYHRQLDEVSGQPAYLEAADERMCGFYANRGYMLTAEAPFYLSDGGPAMWPMVRHCPQWSRATAVAG